MRKVKSFDLLAKPARSFILLAVLLFVNLLTRAQTVDTLTNMPPDSAALVTTSDASSTDSNALTKAVPIAQDDLQDPVFYESLDSIVYDADEKRLYLYRDAQIKYQDITVDASYIIYEQDSSTMIAEALQWELDSVDNHFLTKADEKTKFRDMHFNFKSQRAILSNAYSQYGEGFIKSEKIKRNKDQSIYGLHNIYTTCNLEDPHFGIRAKKVKIIPNKVAVSGSANLVVEDIPTPLFLPLGLFPLKKGQKSGFKLPTYDVSPSLGFGLRQGGYYFAINDHLDAMALADVYSLGTWRVSLLNNYVWRYRFRGNARIEYSYNKQGDEFRNNNQDAKRDFIVRWTHQLDPNVRPGTNFSANVEFGTSSFYRLNSYEASNYLTNNYLSSIAYSKSWAGKPFNLTVAGGHNQNTGTGLVNVQLPQITFSANQLYPFKFRQNIIKPRWYEKITASYQLDAVNNYQFIDTLLDINNIQAKDLQNGIKHTVPINATYNFFRYINANFSATYNEYWLTQKIFQSYNFQQGKLDSNIQNGFFTARDYGLNASFTTRVYGIKLFKKGRVSGIRHVITPNINLQYRPDFGRPELGYYYDTYNNQNYDVTRLSYFQGQVYSGPTNGKVGGVGFGFGNNLQMKVRSKDTLLEDRKINLIDGLDFGTFYNLAVDSFNWSDVSINYRTTIFKKINITGGMRYTPYGIDTATFRPTQEFYWETDNKILRFKSANIALNATLPFNTSSTKKRTEEDQEVIDQLGNTYAQYVDFNIPYSLRLNYNVGFNRNYKTDALTNAFKDTLVVTQNFNFSGDVTLTPKWKIGLSSGYDFITKKLTFTTIDIYRDLHCWEMRLNLIPFGAVKSYNFTLNVKASVLQDLKLVRRKDFRDNF